MKKICLFSLIIANYFLLNNSYAQFTKLHDFSASVSEFYPSGSLVFGGTFLYGMAMGGGTNGFGVIYKIKPDGTGYTIVYNFDGTNGGSPEGSLIYDGTFLYGISTNGGINSKGTIFKIKPDGTEFVKLIDFAGTSNGEGPRGSLYYDGTFLYGMTSYGGTNNLGTIFKIKPDGTGYSKLLDFAGPNGNNPYGSSLISDGTFLYGMTQYGGTNNLGVIFKIKPDGTGYTKMLNFSGTANGSHPHSTFVFDGTYLHGITTGGGTTDEGVIFKIKPNGTGYTTLLEFDGTNGWYPWGSLTSSGPFFYGMTEQGGNSLNGTIFQLKSDGTYTRLHDFDGINGRNPYLSSLISDGTFLYGVTQYGGTSDEGTVFRICIPVNFSQSKTICQGQSITVGSSTYSSSGSYTDTLTSVVSGCDSIVTTNLTVKLQPTASAGGNQSICENGSAVVSGANASNGTKIWTEDGMGSITSGATTLTPTYTAAAGDAGNTVTLTMTVSNSPCPAATATYTVNVYNCTGIEELSNGNAATIYPNPGNGIIHIKSNLDLPASFELYNLLGEKVMQHTMATSDEIINVQGASNGIYIYKITSKSNTICGKWIKE